MPDLSKIDAMIREAEEWRDYYRARNAKGEIEALCANVRLKALRDARAAMERPDA